MMKQTDKLEFCRLISKKLFIQPFNIFVSFSEALCPQVQFDISTQDRAKIIASIRMGISVDMAEYGYPGIIFAPANK